MPTPPSPDTGSGSGSERLASSTSTLALGVNGSSSSSSAAYVSPAPSGRETPAGAGANPAEVLDAARILLAPVVKRQRERAEKNAVEKVSGKGKTKPLNINIPLHGPRVEIVLAWLGAVYLPELDAIA